MILDNQRAFRYDVMEKFGMRDDHLKEDGEIISRKTISPAILHTEERSVHEKAGYCNRTGRCKVLLMIQEDCFNMKRFGSLPDSILTKVFPACHI